jgi:hypothetical protein
MLKSCLPDCALTLDGPLAVELNVGLVTSRR